MYYEIDTYQVVLQNLINNYVRDKAGKDFWCSNKINQISFLVMNINSMNLV